MNPIPEIAKRIRSLREDYGFSPEEMAAATGRNIEDYLSQESGDKDLSFTFLYKVAEKLNIDVIDILTGDSPHLSGYSIVRSGEGLSIKRREGFEYLHKAPFFKGKLCEPFLVTAPFIASEQDLPIHLSQHEGQELDFIVSGKLRFAFEDHVELLEPGDSIIYDSGREHGMIATGGSPCVFLAVVLKEH